MKRVSPCIFLVCGGLPNNGVVFEEIRPGAGFTTGDFVEEKLGGATVVRLGVERLVASTLKELYTIGLRQRQRGSSLLSFFFFFAVTHGSKLFVCVMLVLFAGTKIRHGTVSYPLRAKKKKEAKTNRVFLSLKAQSRSWE